jgi:hypothetical protein
MVKRPRKQGRAEVPAPVGRSAPRVAGMTVYVPPEVYEALYARGARSERQRSAFNASRVVTRTLGRFFALLQQSDPVAAGHLTAAEHETVLALLTEPWELTPFHIRILEAALAERPQLAAVLEKAGLDRAKFLARIAGLSMAEKARLVDDAELRWAPERATARPE